MDVEPQPDTIGSLRKEILATHNKINNRQGNLSGWDEYNGVDSDFPWSEPPRRDAAGVPKPRTKPIDKGNRAGNDLSDEQIDRNKTEYFELEVKLADLQQQLQQLQGKTDADGDDNGSSEKDTSNDNVRQQTYLRFWKPRIEEENCPLEYYGLGKVGLSFCFPLETSYTKAATLQRSQEQLERYMREEPGCDVAMAYAGIQIQQMFTIEELVMQLHCEVNRKLLWEKWYWELNEKLRVKHSKKIIKHLSQDNDKIKAVLNELALQDKGACSELIRELMGSNSASSTAPPEDDLASVASNSSGNSGNSGPSMSDGDAAAEPPAKKKRKD